MELKCCKQILELAKFPQNMTDRSAMRRRLLKYVLPVILLSVALTIPKFFEAEVDYRDVEEEIIATGEIVASVSKSR